MRRTNFGCAVRSFARDGLPATAAAASTDRSGQCWIRYSSIRSALGSACHHVPYAPGQLKVPSPPGPNSGLDFAGSVTTDRFSPKPRPTQNGAPRKKPNTPVVATEFLVTNKTMYTKRGGDYVSVGPAEKIYDPGIILDKDRGLGAVVGQVQNPTIQGRDAIDGLATVKVSGTIDAAVIDPIVPQLGKGGGRLPITLWIVDTNASTPAPAANLVRMVIDKDQGNVDITLSNWGAPVTIPNPVG